MRAFLNTLLMVIALVIVVLLGAPFISGIWIKTHYQQYLKQVNLISPKIGVNIDHYQQGWFSSNATLIVTLPTGNNSQTKYTVTEHIQHGPIILAKIDGHTRVTLALAVVHNKINSSHFKGEYTNIIKWRNEIISIPNIDLATLNFNQHQLTLNKITGKNIHTNQNTIRGIISIKNLTLINHNGITTDSPIADKFSVNNLWVKLNLTRNNSLWYGQRNVSIDQIIYTHGKNKAITLNGIKFKEQRHRNKHTIDYAMDLKVASITSATLKLHPVHLQISADGINAARLRALLKTLTQFKNSKSLGSRQLAMLYFYEPTMKLLEKGLRITLNDFSIGTRKGSMIAQGKIVLPQQDTKTNPIILLQHIQAQLNVKIPKALLSTLLVGLYINDPTQNGMTPLEQAQHKIQAWLQTKILIESGGAYKMGLSFQKGQLLINGQASLANHSKPTPGTTTPLKQPTTLPITGHTKPLTKNNKPQ